MAIMSGGQVVEIICTETDRTFTLPPRPPLAASASGA
jgi:hypothetical protein